MLYDSMPPDQPQQQQQQAVNVKHSWISLEGFTVDGQTSDEDAASSFIDKCVFVYGEDPIVGFSMQGMTVRNCG